MVKMKMSCKLILFLLGAVFLSVCMADEEAYRDYSHSREKRDEPPAGDTDANANPPTSAPTTPGPSLPSGPDSLDGKYKTNTKLPLDDKPKPRAHHMRITTVEHPPYVIINKKNKKRPIYTGFIPDLVRLLSKKCDFSYDYYTAPDGRYGAKQPDGTWTGMIGELIPKQEGDSTDTVADMAAAPITVTGQRSQVVDFIHPFHHLGLTVMVKKDYMRQNDTGFDYPLTFSIFLPLSKSVWAMVIISMFLVGLILSLINRFNPYEWGGRFNLNLASKHHKESFSFTGSLWFAFTTLNWQGFERAPRSIAAKILTSFWFCFVTIVLVGYTGGLVNNLWWASMAKQHNPLKTPISSLRELIAGVHGNDFKIGCMTGGSTYQYLTNQGANFANQEFLALKLYWSTPAGQKQLVDSVSAGVEKVRKEKYAFIAETMEANYYMNKLPCDITTIGEQFATRSYGLALPKNSTLREAINTAIVQLIESEALDDLERKWWKGSSECWNTTFIEKVMEHKTNLEIRQARPKQIDLEMFWGPLVLMIVGVCLSLCAVIGEVLYYKYKGRYQESNRPQGQTLNLDNEDGGI